jgi:hypothetical protein
VDEASLRSGASHESSDKAQRACAVNAEEVGMADLEADVDARKFRKANGVREESGSHLDFDVSSHGRVGCGRSEW